jgi:hypothetical protein
MPPETLHDFADHVAEKISLCRTRAIKCRLNAMNARQTTEEERWLDLAQDWDKLAQALAEENPSRFQ